MGVKRVHLWTQMLLSSVDSSKREVKEGEQKFAFSRTWWVSHMMGIPSHYLSPAQHYL